MRVNLWQVDMCSSNVALTYRRHVSELPSSTASLKSAAGPAACRLQWAAVLLSLRRPRRGHFRSAGIKTAKHSSSNIHIMYERTMYNDHAGESPLAPGGATAVGGGDAIPATMPTKTSNADPKNRYDSSLGNKANESAMVNTFLTVARATTKTPPASEVSNKMHDMPKYEVKENTTNGSINCMHKMEKTLENASERRKVNRQSGNMHAANDAVWLIDRWGRRCVHECCHRR